MFDKSTVDDYMTVVRPKVAGAWNLHHALAGNLLDFFVMLGSVTGVVGNHGQAAYCATTTFLDSFASYRASLGLPASTIDLGAVLDAGWLVNQRSEVQNQIKMVLGTEVREKEVLAILDAAISGHIGKASHYHSIAGLQSHGTDKQKFWSSDPRFAHLHDKKGGKHGVHGSAANKLSVQQALSGASSLAASKKMIYDSLAAKFSSVLMIDAEDIVPDKAMGAYGIDSLVAVELRNWIMRELDAKVMLIHLLADNTLASLTETVVQRSKLCEYIRLKEKQETEAESMVG